MRSWLRNYKAEIRIKRLTILTINPYILVMADEPTNKDSTFSTSDIFKNSQANEKETEIRKRLEKTTGEGYVRRDDDDVPDDLEDIGKKLFRLVHHRKKRNDIGSWEQLFTELEVAGYEKSTYISKKLHRELLREFGYKDKYLRRPRPLERPPIHPRVLEYLFKEMNWDVGSVSRKTSRQREWLEVRAGLREPREPDQKRHKRRKKNSGGCLFWAIIIFVIIVVVS